MKAATTRILLGLLWLAVIGAGEVVLLNFENAPGHAGQTPPQWPSGTPITLDSGRSTLLMFVHPRCPCTRASIGELNRLLARGEDRIAARVLFLKPASLPDEWTQTDSWRQAAAIRGVSVLADLDGALARRFGAETSGYVVLFDTKGRLLFQGGITAGRGHSGDNPGASLILASLAGHGPNLKQTPVYGCSLVEACEAINKGEGVWQQ
jgi:hypothetical protein